MRQCALSTFLRPQGTKTPLVRLPQSVVHNTSRGWAHEGEASSRQVALTFFWLSKFTPNLADRLGTHKSWLCPGLWGSRSSFTWQLQYAKSISRSVVKTTSREMAREDTLSWNSLWGALTYLHGWNHEEWSTSWWGEAVSSWSFMNYSLPEC